MNRQLSRTRNTNRDEKEEMIQSIIDLPNREFEMLRRTVIPKVPRSMELSNKRSIANTILMRLLDMPIENVRDILMQLNAFPDGAKSLIRFCHANKYARDIICDKAFWIDALEKWYGDDEIDPYATKEDIIRQFGQWNTNSWSTTMNVSVVPSVRQTNVSLKTLFIHKRTKFAYYMEVLIHHGRIGNSIRTYGSIVLLKSTQRFQRDVRLRDFQYLRPFRDNGHINHVFRISDGDPAFTNELENFMEGLFVHESLADERHEVFQNNRRSHETVFLRIEPDERRSIEAFLKKLINDYIISADYPTIDQPRPTFIDGILINLLVEDLHNFE